MDFAILLGDKRTNIYKRGQGIVLNEPTALAYTYEPDRTMKILAVGKAALKFSENLAALPDKNVKPSVTFPIKEGKIADVKLAAAVFVDLFNRVSNQNIVIKRKCLFCIPSSLTSKELGDYKSVIYPANIAEVEFVSNTITSAIGLGYGTDETAPIVSVVIEEGLIDVTAIDGMSVIAGGTVECEYGKATVRIRDYKLIIDTILQIIDEVSGLTAQPVSKVCIGGRDACSKELKDFISNNLNLPIVLDERSFNSVINGAGKILSDEKLISRIVKAN